MQEAVRVRGEIALPEAPVPSGRVDVIVVVEDVSRADAPAIVVGEQRLAQITLPTGAGIPFEIEVPSETIDPRHMYSVRAHINVRGSGAIEKGDLISTQSYPVLTRGHGDQVRVRVRQI